jgi:arginyl-tRNA synthetase
VLAVGPLTVRHRGCPVQPSDVPAILATPAARFALAGIPIDAPAVLDAERLASDRIDNPWVAVRYALTRIARVAGSVPLDPVALDALGESDRDCLRGIGFHADVVALAARRVAPDGLVAHARELAAVFHRHYNGGAFAEGTAARRVLASGVGRVLEATLEMLGAAPAERV